MPIFGRKADNAAAQGTVRIDPALGDPGLARLRQAMAVGEWPAARDLLESAADPDDLATLVDAIGPVQGTEQWLPDVVRADLNASLPLLVYGTRVVRWAWEARSDLLAKYVTREQFELFFERLGIAEDSLQGVVRREPDNITAWYQLLISARGLQLGIDEAWRRFDQVVSRYPGHVRAHQQMLQQLCRKWSGSHEAMHEFARDAMLRAPAGSPLGQLVAIAHMEHWAYLCRDKPSNRYLQSREVLASLHEAADRSVRHPAYRRQRDWPEAHNVFAMVFSLAGDRYAAARQFDVIGELATEFPWNYLGSDPAGQFESWRSKALTNRGWAAR